MASIHKEFLINASADAVWDAVKDVGVVHRRLVPGLVTNTVMEPGARLVTFASGKTIRELIVDIDDTRRRVAYASVGGLAQHHNASMQVFPEGENQCRFVWITDVLPNEIAGPVGGLVEKGSSIIKTTMEAADV